MVIRRVAGTGAAPRRRPFSLFAPLLLVAVAAAQEPAPSGGAPSSGAPSAVAPSTTAPSQVAPVYGRVVADSAPLRCWSSAVAAPPVFEDVLVKGEVVQLGRVENGFRAVLLPLGPLGYVTKRFTSVAEDGTVTTSGTKVSFRYRPRTSEAPVAQLADGTTLHVVGEQDDWFQARVPGIEAWVAAAEVEVVDAPDAEVLALHDALRARMQAQVQARLDAIAAEQKRLEQSRIDMEAVQVVERAFAQELQKPLGEQRYAPLMEALTKLDGTLAETSEAKVAVAALKKRIETQQWIAEATAVKNATPPAEPDPAPPPPTDRLERFEAIGWLRYERHLAGPGVYFLEKGGRRQHVLSCNTGRYDLALFVGREVGVIGPRRQPPTESLSVLDVERIEVLGSTPRD